MQKISDRIYKTYSVIVPSFNRVDEIAELLQSFLALEFDNTRLELIIADDGSTDQTREVVIQYQPKFAFPLHFYSQENQGPGVARNMGMEKASGDFFIFIDSDCTISPQWLKNIDQELHREKADAFGGRDSFRADFPDLLKAINYSMTSFITTGGLRGRKGKKLAKFYPRSFNMGLSRKLYLEIGGFGTLRHGQDIEYSNRIIKSGAKVLYIDEAVVYHKRRTGINKFFRQVFNWGVARINLYKLDSSMLEPLHAAPAVVTVFLILILLTSLIFPSMWFFVSRLIGIGLLILLLSGLHAALKYRRISMIYLVPLIMPIQIIGYGLGFSIAFFYRIGLNKPEFTGFKKRYYN
jgi:glycosyltransferase involved in cell wall biosynthesis